MLAAEADVDWLRYVRKRLVWVIDYSRVEHIKRLIVQPLCAERVDATAEVASFDHAFWKRLRYISTIEQITQASNIVILTLADPPVMLIHHLLQFGVDAEGVAEVALARFRRTLSRPRRSRSDNRIIHILKVDFSSWQLLML